jgi:murein DD-endopeptidase MepM/ murein hydrolase activator NlpD
VVSAADGIVLEVDRGNGFGNYVKIKHPASGYITLYAHLTKAVDTLRQGQRVSRGQVIAFSGNSGLSSAPHLHYEVHDLEGRTLNPVFFFAPSMTPAEYQKLLSESEASTVSFD